MIKKLLLTIIGVLFLIITAADAQERAILSVSGGYGVERFVDQEVTDVFPLLHGPSVGVLIRPWQKIGFGAFYKNVSAQGDLEGWLDLREMKHQSFGLEVRFMPKNWLSIYGKYAWSTINDTRSFDNEAGVPHLCDDEYKGNPISLGVRLETSSTNLIGLFIAAQWNINEFSTNFNDGYGEMEINSNSYGIQAGITVNLFRN